MPSSIPLHVLAISRMAIGVAALLIPLPTCSAFLIPVPATATLAVRLAGARDLAIGGLLLHSLRNSSAATATKSNGPIGLHQDETKQPLLDGQKAKMKSGSDAYLRSALLAGMVVDGIDVLSSAACFLEGNVSIEGALVFASGAGLFLGMGSWGFVRMG